MADPPPYDSNRGTGVGPDPGSTAGTPRWVKVFGLIALVVVLVVVILLLAGGGGGHGPGRHTAARDAGGHTPPSSGKEFGGVGGHEPPAGRHTPR
jgi:hypothetical protein